MYVQAHHIFSFECKISNKGGPPSTPFRMENQSVQIMGSFFLFLSLLYFLPICRACETIEGQTGSFSGVCICWDISRSKKWVQSQTGKIKGSLFWFWWYKKKKGLYNCGNNKSKEREKDGVHIFRRASLRDLALYRYKISPSIKQPFHIRKSLIACFSFLGEPLAMTTFLTIPTIASRYSIHDDRIKWEFFHSGQIFSWAAFSCSWGRTLFSS